ncbi:MAG TPA: hypothetical protein VLA76_05525 [Candidatus Angelobacter sp.]|nr:hypothetical protein [Candidatus Angelobacter sp.]
MTQRNLVPGLILIVLGAFLFFVQSTGVGGEAIVAMIGGGFLIAYAVTRNYGFLVPGGILTGLGLGIVWETSGPTAGGVVLIGLGLGFVSIWLVDMLMKHTPVPWWPLVPGGILATIGFLVETGREGMLSELSWLWPVALIAIGLVLLFSTAVRRSEEPTSSEQAHQP